ncbi:MAG: sulfatase-like hydrolase/transferase, partial [Mangrovibacterium sp.]
MKKVSLLMLQAITFGFTAQAAKNSSEKQNILVILGDDIAYWNLSYNNRGIMGYNTPTIDAIANSGMIFTDYYAEQ